MNTTAKKTIDELTKQELLAYRVELSEYKTRAEQLTAAGRIVSSMWVLHWTSEDAEYLIKKCGIRPHFG